jgi:hypothetical protein
LELSSTSYFANVVHLFSAPKTEDIKWSHKRLIFCFGAVAMCSLLLTIVLGSILAFETYKPGKLKAHFNIAHNFANKYVCTVLYLTHSTYDPSMTCPLNPLILSTGKHKKMNINHTTNHQ